MSRVKVELARFERGKGHESGHIFEYSVEHDDGKTSVEQMLTIRSADGLFEPNWVASIALDDFPPQSSPQAAAEKLADWLERLSAAVRTGEYQTFSDSKFIDVDNT